MTERAVPDEGFLRRWARRKTEARAEPAPVAASGAAALPAAAGVAAAPAADIASAPVPLPTMDDVARLTGDSDFSAFVARGVDAAVRRTALKKLFADPHFNTMDRLDVYIDDYTKPSPVSETMLASLEHAKRLFRRAVDADDDADNDAAGADDPGAGRPAVADHASTPITPTTPPETETR
ncbi:DUF3306 domain-containing protein [Massilia sp. Root335]|uniref:DUF3306 domain-containing protein n=1 Tax=Massilia sp. Root335 TaxID=1736517 RepID=UPI0006FF876D|nr:DUF3306 domain-containing protein [Massilia sp. Root335]KQV52086.1 hypothetical protein ASC93_05485 [Massilia sp. Root335]